MLSSLNYDTVDLLVSALRRYGISYVTRPDDAGRCDIQRVEPKNCTDVGRRMISERFCPTVAESYRFAPVSGNLSVVAVLKVAWEVRRSMAVYCRHWEHTESKQLLDQLVECLIRDLPGWVEAPEVWTRAESYVS